VPAPVAIVAALLARLLTTVVELLLAWLGWALGRKG